MKACLAAAALAAILSACASFDGRGLMPGQSTAQEVEALMGPSHAVRQQPNGERWVYYSREPFGRAIYLARIGPGGVLVAIEQTLTDLNIDRIEKGKWTREEVANLLGPPSRVTKFPRNGRESWEYFYRPNGVTGSPMVLYVTFAPEGTVYEIDRLDESSLYISPSGFIFR